MPRATHTNGRIHDSVAEEDVSRSSAAQPSNDRRRTTTVDKVMLEARAASFTKRSIKKSSKIAALKLAISMVDLTTLEGADTPEKVRSLCRKAIRPHESIAEIPSVAAVCVYPSMVKVAKVAVAGSGVHVASVATGFPSGQYPLSVRLADAKAAIEDGADEIDMVINRGAFLAGDYQRVADEIAQVRTVCVAGHAHLKIILETGELGTYDQVRRASDLAIEAASSVSEAIADGEVFIKTSTGKVSSAATLPVTLVMLEAIWDHFDNTGVRIGMKPAGGIRDAKTAIQYLVMVQETLGSEWLTPTLFRFGASSLLNDLIRQYLKQQSGHYIAAYDVSEA